VSALSSSPSATLNYGLTSNTITLTDAGASAAGNLNNNTIASTAFNVATGIASNSTVFYTFANKATVPTTITLRATDNDSVVSTGYETAASTIIRSGRVRLQNAYGSELLALPVGTSIQQYSATGWGTNVDTCTNLVDSNFSFNFPVDSKNSLSACKIAITVTGVNPSPTVTLSAPGSGNNGWTNLTLNLSSAVIGAKCIAVGVSGGAETPANLPWLEYEWNGIGTFVNPTARATFGIYKSPLIYRRENY
jgi:MSHA biogenesis protein MshQ